jgi:hypothetical protein
LSASSVTRAARRGERIGALAGAIEHEPERRPRLAVVRSETARLARVLRGQRQRRTVRRSSARVISNCMMQALARPTCADA